MIGPTTLFAAPFWNRTPSSTLPPNRPSSDASTSEALYVPPTTSEPPHHSSVIPDPFRHPPMSETSVKPQPEEALPTAQVRTSPVSKASFLPQTVGPQTEAQKIGFEKHLSRPVWRIVLGSIMIGASPLFLGFGGRALWLDGRCIDGPDPIKCNTVFNTQPLGIGLTVAGSLLAIAGVIMIAVPEKKIFTSYDGTSSKASQTQASSSTHIGFEILPQGAYVAFQKEF